MNLWVKICKYWLKKKVNTKKKGTMKKKEKKRGIYTHKYTNIPYVSFYPNSDAIDCLFSYVIQLTPQNKQFTVIYFPKTLCLY